jgi:hypothetical protein
MTRRLARRKAAAPGALVVPHFPGVEPRTWTDLSPAAYPPHVAELIRGVLDARQTGNIVTVNGYRCAACDTLHVTRDLHPGVTPAFIDHQQFTPATLCPGVCESLDYPRHGDLGDPSHEWYRPSEDELITRAGDVATPSNRQTGDRVVNHVLSGGLLLRPIPTTGATA